MNYLIYRIFYGLLMGQLFSMAATTMGWNVLAVCGVWLLGNIVSWWSLLSLIGVAIALSVVVTWWYAVPAAFVVVFIDSAITARANARRQTA